MLELTIMLKPIKISKHPNPHTFVDVLRSEIGIGLDNAISSDVAQPNIRN